MATISVETVSSPSIVPAAAGSTDSTPPTVTYTLPSGSRIAQDTPISVSVNDETGILSCVVLVVQWPLASHTLPTETAWNGSGFEPFYRDASSVVRTATGFDFVIARKNGWPTTPRFSALAVDGGGNRAT